MKLLRNLTKEKVGYAALCVALASVIAVEYGVTKGALILGGILYSASLIVLVSATLSIIAARKNQFRTFDWLMLLYVAAFAGGMSFVPWYPLLFLSIIGSATGLFIWLVVNLLHRQSLP